MSSELPFQLMAWIKREQEERRQHTQKMAVRNFADDAAFMEYVQILVDNWKILSVKDKLMLNGIAKHRGEGRCLSRPQRSAVIALYLKHAY